MLWVPPLLKNHEMERRVMDSKTFLRRFEKEGDTFLNPIITTDETWLFINKAAVESVEVE